MSQYRQLTELVSCIEAGNAYGLEPNKAGFCRCPFHNEKTGSMKLYEDDRGWYCFGCHNGGSVVTLVQGLFNLTRQEAMQKLNDDFRCGLNIGGSLNSAKANALERLQVQRKKEAAVYNQFMQWKQDMCSLMQRVVTMADIAEQYRLLPARKSVLTNRSEDGLPTDNPLSALAPEEAEALRIRRHLEYMMCVLGNDNDDESMEIFRHRRRVVRKCMEILLPDSTSNISGNS